MIHFLTWLIYPMTTIVCGAALALGCRCRGMIKTSRWLFALSLCWLCVWGTEAVPGRLGYMLEREYPPLPLAKVVQADAIVILGGSMGPPKGVCIYPELFTGADRVWHAARLYHAGKAPVIIPSGSAEAGSSVVLLRDLGVPPSAILVEDKAKNTIENGLYTKELMRKRGLKKALLVTSAYHMRRSEMIFKTLGVQVVPVATDHEMTYGRQVTAADPKAGWSWLSFIRWLPSASMLDRSAWYLKEVVGYWGDAWRLRKVS